MPAALMVAPAMEGDVPRDVEKEGAALPLVGVTRL